MAEIQAQATGLWASLWSWTGIPVSGPRMSCLGAGSGCRSESWAHPSPGARHAGGSKLNLHTRVHCGCSAWPWALPALPARGKCFPSGSSWSHLSLAKALAPHPGFSHPVGSWTPAAQSSWVQPPFHSQCP